MSERVINWLYGPCVVFFFNNNTLLLLNVFPAFTLDKMSGSYWNSVFLLKRCHEAQPHGVSSTTVLTLTRKAFKPNSSKCLIEPYLEWISPNLDLFDEPFNPILLNRPQSAFVCGFRHKYVFGIFPLLDTSMNLLVYPEFKFQKSKLRRLSQGVCLLRFYDTLGPMKTTETLSP